MKVKTDDRKAEEEEEEKRGQKWKMEKKEKLNILME